MTTPSHYDVAVIGGGQAGLAIGYYLAEQGRRFVILERAEDVAPAWRERWDSLTLFTPRAYDSLPGLDFPGEPDGYPTRDEVVAYLRSYAEYFDLPLKLGTAARRLTQQDGRFVIETGDGQLTADQVVVATGPFQEPRIPEFASALDTRVVQLHSTGYRKSDDLPNGRVLVVGGGNTGYQIAHELAATRETHIAVGTRQPALPQRLFGRDLFFFLTKTGLLYKSVDTRIGQRMSQKETLVGRLPKIAKCLGVISHGRVTNASGRSVTFADGSELEVAGVIWATGFRYDHSWIDLPVTDPDGRVKHRRGVTGVRGLYTLGLQWQYTRGSALLGFVKADAQYLAEQIGAHPAAAAAGRAGWRPSGRSHYRSTRRLRMEHHTHTDAPAETFSTDVAGLPAARATEVVSLADGELFEMTIEPVAKHIGDDTVRMLGYNGSVPGPTLRAPEGAEIQVKVENRGDLDATVHWHGLRLDNAYDGTHETQKPMAVGESFTYHVHCPDPGAYWYHPHIREDYGQELGLYGNLIVAPADPDYWAPAHREVAITLDDILIEDGKVAPFFREDTTYAAMGRFGNVMLAAGEPDLQLTAARGEVVRLFFTNTANTRVFNVGIGGARMKLVGGDSGRCERETFVESVVLAPSERAVVDVLFDSAGEAQLEHRTPDTTYKLGTVTVDGEATDPAPGLAFDTLRENPEFAELRAEIAPRRTDAPDKSLAFVAEMDFEAPEGAVIYVCPMHPEVISETEGSCPECGMKLMPQAAPVAFCCPMHPNVVSAQPGKCPDCGMKLMPTASIYTCPMHPTVLSSEQGKCPDCGMKLMPTAGIFVCPMHPMVLSSEQGKCPECGMKLMPASMIGGESHEHEMEHGHDEPHEMDHAEHHAEAGHHDHAHAGGIEWEDDMVEVNKTTTPGNTRWKLIDRQSGAENHGINWEFKVGDWVKIELVNEMDSDHPMHHPFHVHGAGRFLVLDRDGVEDDNLVWKDTVLIRTAERINILLEVTNVGRWMAHCHIAEHHETGMMFSFEVTE